MSRTTPGGGTSNFNGIRADDTKGQGAPERPGRVRRDHLVKHDRKKTVNHDETTHVKHDRTEDRR